MSAQTEVVITRPNDGHLHVRQGSQVAVVLYTARQFGQAVIMPNTQPPITTVEAAAKYRNQILATLPRDSNFKPLMTLYLQEVMSPETIKKAKRSGFIYGIKMYPAGVTTHSEAGVRRLPDVEEQLRVMEEVDLPLMIHGESAEPTVDVFDRETVFYNECFQWLTRSFPRLRISCEHITTRAAVEMVQQAPKHLRLNATITPQALLVDRNYMLGNKLRPHAFCKPILKSKDDRLALLEAVISGDPRISGGTDSAPHERSKKEGDCGCAGCFTGHAAPELYAEALDEVNGLHRLNGFLSEHLTNFLELEPNSGTVTLVRERWTPDPIYPIGAEGGVVPFRAEQPLEWRLVN